MRKVFTTKEIRKAVRDLRSIVKSYEHPPLGWRYGFRVIGNELRAYHDDEIGWYNAGGYKITLFKPYSNKDIRGFLRNKIDNIILAVVDRLLDVGFKIVIDENEKPSLKNAIEKRIREHEELERWEREYEERILGSLGM